MSKELRCRLIRNTMTSMIAILRAKGDGESHRYPSKLEITAMAKRIVLNYPMLQDQDLKNSWVSEIHPINDQSVLCCTFLLLILQKANKCVVQFTVYAQLNKRLKNVRSPKKTLRLGDNQRGKDATKD
ncbi:hypothetical protein ILYODFUR_038911 [Ilyodon furcidens]|uniref:Uncharacterized protein n=1 Tax=Ilyodon furcidens TaxID=33524 RepID=A0ABV0T6K3_9TELE